MLRIALSAVRPGLFGVGVVVAGNFKLHEHRPTSFFEKSCALAVCGLGLNDVSAAVALLNGCVCDYVEGVSAEGTVTVAVEGAVHGNRETVRGLSCDVT